MHSVLQTVNSSYLKIDAVMFHTYIHTYCHTILLPFLNDHLNSAPWDVQDLIEMPQGWETDICHHVFTLHHTTDRLAGS